MNISGKTRIIALLGYPVEHSISPQMHNAAFEHLNIPYCYVAFPVRNELLSDAVRAIKAFNLAGVNVTVPHKENVIPLLDEVDKEASLIGAVNTIVNKDGRLTGYNTDGMGFMQSLLEEGIQVEGKDILIVGAGGASKAISYYLSEKASKLFLFDVDKGKEQALINYLVSLGRTVYSPDSLGMASAMDIIINATPLGLKDKDLPPLDLNLIHSRQVVADLIYKETPLLKAASQKGCYTFNGMGMLLWQGVFAFELWTGIKPPVHVMKKALIEAMGGSEKGHH